MPPWIITRLPLGVVKENLLVVRFDVELAVPALDLLARVVVERDGTVDSTAEIAAHALDRTAARRTSSQTADNHDSQDGYDKGRDERDPTLGDIHLFGSFLLRETIVPAFPARGISPLSQGARRWSRMPPAVLSRRRCTLAPAGPRLAVVAEGHALGIQPEEPSVALHTPFDIVDRSHLVFIQQIPSELLPADIVCPDALLRQLVDVPRSIYCKNYSFICCFLIHSFARFFFFVNL